MRLEGKMSNKSLGCKHKYQQVTIIINWAMIWLSDSRCEERRKTNKQLSEDKAKVQATSYPNKYNSFKVKNTKSNWEKIGISTKRI